MKLLNEQFFNIVELDKQFASELTDMFKKSTLEIITDFTKAIENNEKDQAKRLAHTAKGSAANVGAELLFENFKSLEQEVLELDDINIDSFKDKITEIENVLENTIIEAKSYLQ